MDTLDFLKQEKVKVFIEKNVGTDIQKFLLNPTKEFKGEAKLIAVQILSRQKAKGKLDRWATNFDIVMPPPVSIEQASSETTGDYKSNLIAGKQLVDLTGGMGIDCIKLSEKFDKSIYVERREELCEIFKHNTHILKKSIEIVNQSAEDFLDKFEGNSETIFYVDPARRDDLKKRVFKLEDCSPNLIDLIPNLSQKGKGILVKLSPLLDLSSIIASIAEIKEIHVVSVKNDCKEILLYIDFEFKGNIKIVCVNLSTDQKSYTYSWKEETISGVTFGKVSTYLYEPNSSIMKAGSFKKISADFNVFKIASNTHLYTSNEIIHDFPGKIFKVKSIVDKKLMKSMKGRTINVITRNYVKTASELKKSLKIKDGGDEFLMAFKDQKSNSIMLIAERLLL